MLTSAFRSCGRCLVCTGRQCMYKYLSEMESGKDKIPGPSLNTDEKTKFKPRPNSVTDEDLLKWSQGESYNAHKVNIVDKNKNLFQQRLFGDMLAKNDTYPRNMQYTSDDSVKKLSKFNEEPLSKRGGKPFLIEVIKKYHPACEAQQPESIVSSTKTTKNCECASPGEQTTPSEETCSKVWQAWKTFVGNLETKFTGTNSQGKPKEKEKENQFVRTVCNKKGLSDRS